VVLRDAESEDAGGCLVSPQGAAGPSQMCANVGSNSMQRGGPGQLRSSIQLVRPLIPGTCERLTSEMTENRWMAIHAMDCHAAFVEDTSAPIFNRTAQSKNNRSLTVSATIFCVASHCSHRSHVHYAKPGGMHIKRRTCIIPFEILSWHNGMTRVSIDVGLNTKYINWSTVY